MRPQIILLRFTVQLLEGMVTMLNLKNVLLDALAENLAVLLCNCENEIFTDAYFSALSDIRQLRRAGDAKHPVSPYHPQNEAA